jgi:hypothetical protein
MPDFDYMVKATCATLRADVLVNDCLVFRHAAPWLREAELKLTPWIVQGQNRLEVRVAPLPEEVLGPIRATGQKPPESLFLLGGHIVSKVTGKCLGANEVLRYRWTEGESALPTVERAAVFKHRWLVPATFGPWVWERARPFEPSDRTALLALVEQLHALLLARKLDVLATLVGVKLEELCRAYGFERDAIGQEHMRFLEAAVHAQDFALDPLHTETLRLELDAGGRLVRVLDAEGHPPLLGRANGRPFAYDLALSNVDGAWLVVR